MTAPVQPDYVEALREALVSALDTAPQVVALTGRAEGNVVPFDTLEEDTPLPVIAYTVVDANEGVMAGNYDAVVQLAAIALDQMTAHTLAGAADQSVTHLALKSATPALDAAILTRTRRPAGWDREADAARSDVDLTISYSLL